MAERPKDLIYAVDGALGTPGMSASPSLVGLEKTTGAPARDRMVSRGVAGPAGVLPQVFKQDHQHAASRPGSRAFFQWVLDVRRRHPDRGEPPGHVTRFVDRRLFNFSGAGGDDLSGVLQVPALMDAPVHGFREEQSFVSGLNGYLSGLHADRIERSAKGEACEIKLLFRL
jgi:hypothetical protein